jgi:putative spermidine/putrescine transport system substrate-binding protein
MKNPILHALPLAALLVGALAIAGCAGATPTAVPPTSAPSGMDALIAAAKAEGTLTTIALPSGWCNYVEQMIPNFQTKYGIKVNDLNPDGSSAAELQAITANKDNKGPQAPDVVDVGFAFGDTAKQQGLIAPYKVSTWDSIPAGVKDPDGYWYGDYGGVIAFAINADVVKNEPQDWSDLVKPDYKGQVALTGDPRISNQAIQSVEAAALGNGGSLDNFQPGLDLFAKINKAGNLVPVIATTAMLSKGETPIEITWDYLGLADRDQANGNPKIDVIVPKTGRFFGVYVQAISAYAPHPNAAKLWMEYLYSDEGQMTWLKAPGYCHPVRQADMEKRGVIPQADLAKLPDIAGAVYPSNAQLNAGKDLITKSWDSTVGADIKKP